MPSLTHALEARAFRRLKNLRSADRLRLVRKINRFSKQRGFLHRRNRVERPFPHPIALSPFVIPSYLIEKFRQLASAVYRFQVKLPELYRRNYQNIQELFPLDEGLKNWLSFYKPPKAGELLIRLDTTFGIDPKTNLLYPILFESNSTALAGLSNHSVGVTLLKNLVFPKIFSKNELAKLSDPPHLLDFVCRWFLKKNANRVALVEDYPIESGYGEIPRLGEYFKKRGLQVRHCHPEDLNQPDIDLVYRDLSLKNIDLQNPKIKSFKTLFQRGRVKPGLASDFSYKAMLECLTSGVYNKLFNQAERVIFRQSVPWTRVIADRITEDSSGARINLLSYLKTRKKELVIKPNLDAGGSGVVLGDGANNACWDGLIKRALSEKSQWVVQKRVPAPTKKMVYLKNDNIYFSKCYFTFGVFYYPDQVGLHCRISPFRVANVGRGGSLACVFVGDNLHC